MGASPPTDLRPERAYTLPDHLRLALSEPWGPVVDTPTLGLMLGPDDIVIAVGDVVSLSLKELGIRPRLFVCDYKTQRGDDDERFKAELGAWGDREIAVDNPAAKVTAEAWDAVRDALGQPAGVCTRIVVTGEEDLLGLPCFMEAPQGAVVVYGMPGKGAAACVVTDELRDKVARVVRSMHRG